MNNQFQIQDESKKMLSLYLKSENINKIHTFIYIFSLIELNKIKFNFYALQLGPFYLLYRKIYKEGLLSFLLLILFYFIPIFSTYLITGLFILIGFYSNTLLYKNFKRFEHIYIGSKDINKNKRIILLNQYSGVNVQIIYLYIFIILYFLYDQIVTSIDIYNKILNIY